VSPEKVGKASVGVASAFAGKVAVSGRNRGTTASFEKDPAVSRRPPVKQGTEATGQLRFQDGKGEVPTVGATAKVAKP